MFCAKCQKDVTDCTCPDIEERLGNLYQNPHTRPAAAMNILGWKVRQAELKVEEIEAENKQLQAALKKACELLGKDNCPVSMGDDGAAWDICKKGACDHNGIVCWMKYFLAMGGEARIDAICLGTTSKQTS